jgi:hypothetical protein
MNAREIFQSVTAEVHGLLHGGESFALSFNAEQSSFVRFNVARVRQPTSVLQIKASLDLRCGRRHAEAELTLTGTRDDDHARLKAVVDDLRSAITQLADDPYLLIPEPRAIVRVDSDGLQQVRL